MKSYFEELLAAGVKMEYPKDDASQLPEEEVETGEGEDGGEKVQPPKEPLPAGFVLILQLCTLAGTILIVGVVAMLFSDFIAPLSGLFGAVWGVLTFVLAFFVAPWFFYDAYKAGVFED